MLDPEDNSLTADPPDPDDTGGKGRKTLTAEPEEVIDLDTAKTAFAPPLKPADPPDTAGGGG